MKTYHVIGIENKKGNFTNDQKETIGYDNVLLKCIVESTSAKDKKRILKGFDVDEIKIKNNFDELVYVGTHPVYSMIDLVGCSVELDQNSDGKIDCIEVVNHGSLGDLLLRLGSDF